MTTFNLRFHTDSPAFEGSGSHMQDEIIAILHRAIAHIEQHGLEDDPGPAEGKLHDTDGNLVGSWCFAGERESLGRIYYALTAAGVDPEDQPTGEQIEIILEAGS